MSKINVNRTLFDSEIEEFVRDAAERYNLDRSDIRGVIRSPFKMMREIIPKGDRNKPETLKSFRIYGLGMFELKPKYKKKFTSYKGKKKEE